MKAAGGRAAKNRTLDITTISAPIHLAGAKSPLYDRLENVSSTSPQNTASSSSSEAKNSPVYDKLESPAGGGGGAAHLQVRGTEWSLSVCLQNPCLRQRPGANESLSSVWSERRWRCLCVQ